MLAAPPLRLRRKFERFSASGTTAEGMVRARARARGSRLSATRGRPLRWAKRMSGRWGTRCTAAAAAAVNRLKRNVLIVLARRTLERFNRINI